MLMNQAKNRDEGAVADLHRRGAPVSEHKSLGASATFVECRDSGLGTSAKQPALR